MLHIHMLTGLLASLIAIQALHLQALLEAKTRLEKREEGLNLQNSCQINTQLNDEAVVEALEVLNFVSSGGADLVNEIFVPHE